MIMNRRSRRKLDRPLGGQLDVFSRRILGAFNGNCCRCGKWSGLICVDCRRYRCCDCRCICDVEVFAEGG